MIMIMILGSVSRVSQSVGQSVQSLIYYLLLTLLLTKNRFIIALLNIKKGGI